MAIGTFEFEPAAPGSARPRLRLIEGDGEDQGVSRPRCEAAPGGHPAPAIHLRATIAVAVITLVVLLALLALPLAALGGRAVDPGSPVGAGARSGLPVQTGAGLGRYYVVRPGDTLRSIAARLDPGDVGRAEARLGAELGSKVIVPGEHVEMG